MARYTPMSQMAKECIFENYFFYLSTETYVVGTQKNCLIENTCLN